MLKLKKSGKLILSGDGKKNKYKDITKIASLFMFEFIKFEQGVTLRQFFNLFNNDDDVDIFNNILTFCYFEDLMKEAFRKDGKKDTEIDYLVVSKNGIEIHPDKYSFKCDWFGNKKDRNKLVTIEPYTIGNDYYDFVGKKKDVDEIYGIWPCSISKYMDCSIVLEDTFPLYKYRVITELKKDKEYIIDTVRITTQYRMMEVLYAICYEMTFDGVYTLEDEAKQKNGKKTEHKLMDTLKERLKNFKERNKKTKKKKWGRKTSQ